MSSIAGNDKYIQFVIDHYDEIKGLNDILEYTRKKLPPLVSREIVEAIFELEDKFREQGVLVDEEKADQEIWWHDPNLYDMKTTTGPFFGFWYNLDWSSINVNDPEETNNLFLYVEADSIKDNKARYEYIDQWITLLKIHELKLRKSNFLLWYKDKNFDYDEPYLVGYPLHKVIRLEKMAATENFRLQIQEAAKVFTSTLLPILWEYKSPLNNPSAMA